MNILSIINKVTSWKKAKTIMPYNKSQSATICSVKREPNTIDDDSSNIVKSQKSSDYYVINMNNYEEKKPSTFIHVERHFIISLFGSEEMFDKFKQECSTIYNLGYRESSVYEMFEHFSHNGLEYTLSSNGMTTRSLLVIDVSKECSTKLFDLIRSNRFREFKITWNYLKYYLNEERK